MARRKDFQLNRDLIAETALSLFSEHGLSGLSTRKVAAALGASPMSLYVHVRNKEGLLDVVVERLMMSVKIDIDSEASWPAQAEQWAHSLRQQLSAHPGIMGMLHSRRWAMVRCTEPLVRALLAAGFSEAAAVRATRLLTWSTVGFLTVESGVEPIDRPAEAPADVERSLSRLDELEGGAGRLRAADSHGVDRDDIDALFSLQVRLLIDGLAARADSELRL